jgi:hypothetical protein
MESSFVIDGNSMRADGCRFDAKPQAEVARKVKMAAIAGARLGPAQFDSAANRFPPQM